MVIDMSNYAIIENNLVINTCVWDGSSDWNPPEGTTAVEIPIDTVAGVGYHYIDGQFIAPVIPPISAADNKATADQILSDTDWTSIPAVGNPDQSNPYLTNQTAWLYYRSKIRDISLSPPEGNVDWLTPPEEKWSS